MHTGDTFSYVKKNIMTLVFHHGFHKQIIFWKVCFWPYYLHSADNMANQNLPLKNVNWNIKAENSDMKSLKVLWLVQQCKCQFS